MQNYRIDFFRFYDTIDDFYWNIKQVLILFYDHRINLNFEIGNFIHLIFLIYKPVFFKIIITKTDVNKNDAVQIMIKIIC